MSLETVSSALASLATIGLISALFAGPWQWVMVDWFRCKVFAIRDHLFDEAMVGRIEFDSPDYIETRKSMNAFLRVAPSLSLASVLGHLWAARRGSSLAVPGHQRDSGVASSRRPAEQALMEAKQRVDRLAITMLLVRSPVLGLACLAWLFVPRIKASHGQEGGRQSASFLSAFEPVNRVIHNAAEAG